MSQVTRYNELCTLAGNRELDSAYHAAFYLLSNDKELFESARKFVDHDGIDFAGMKRSTRGFDERTRFIVDIAHNLFSYNSKCAATPFEISRLGYPLMEQVCNALYIAADQIKVVVQQNENGKDTMELDTEPYKKTIRICSRMEQLTQRIADELEKADELER